MVLSGLLPVDKPQGWTSHDVVARVRRLSGQRQVGHAGTLDPLATGVLVLVLGGATRLSSYLMNSTKIYRAEVVLGATTVTDDAEAPVEGYRDPSAVTRAAIEEQLGRFHGEIDQVPPRYAAVRQRGEKLYVLARKGVEVRPEPRRVRIDRIEVEMWCPPRLRLRVECGPGTYVRALARDVGAALGVGGYLHALRRLASGSFTAERAVSLERLGDAVASGGTEALAARLEPPDRAVLDWPAAAVGEEASRRVLNGQAISVGRPVSGNLRVYGPTGDFLALAEGRGPVVKPFLVFGRGA
jgi:tRNA pseudouridine55 synthase